MISFFLHIYIPGVNVATCAKGKQVSTVICVIKDIGRSSVDGDSAGIGGRIRGLTSMQLQGVKVQFSFRCLLGHFLLVSEKKRASGRTFLYAFSIIFII